MERSLFQKHSYLELPITVWYTQAIPAWCFHKQQQTKQRILCATGNLKGEMN